MLSRAEKRWQTCSYIYMYIYSWAFTFLSAWVCKHIYILQVSIYLFWMQIQLQQSFSEAQLLGNHCLLCNLASLLDGVFDSTVYLLDFMRTRPSIVTNHLASKCDDVGEKNPSAGFSSDVNHNLLEQWRVWALIQEEAHYSRGWRYESRAVF